MIKHEKSIRYKFLACLLAVTLVFGLSALPAFAVPVQAQASSLLLSRRRQAGEEKTLIENPTKEKPAIEKPASENTPKAPSDNSWTAGMTGDGATEDGSAKESESSSPLETFGAVLQAEGELAFENTTGIGVQSDYDSDIDRSYNTYDKYTAKDQKT